jgi:ABC-type nitrate/sulfonate/bicarbonate transport system substrate-binding protein
VSGPGTPLYWALDAINKANPSGPRLGFADFKISVFPPADMPQALKNGSIEAAIVNQPYAKQLANDPCCTFVANQALTLGYWVAGPSLIKDRPEVGAAFVRAVLRAIRDHLQGNWTSDTALIGSLAKALTQPTSAILGAPATNFGPGDPAGELAFWDDGVLAPTQQEYFDKTKLLGTTFLKYSKPLTNDDIYDKSFITDLTK